VLAWLTRLGHRRELGAIAGQFRAEIEAMGEAP
jgi:hypothetical protein